MNGRSGAPYVHQIRSADKSGMEERRLVCTDRASFRLEAASVSVRGSNLLLPKAVSAQGRRQ